jgi:hypothetical protein
MLLFASGVMVLSEVIIVLSEVASVFVFPLLQAAIPNVVINMQADNLKH